jgi:hypothetical protein
LNSTNTAWRRVRPVAEADQLVDVDQREIAGMSGDARNRVRRSAGDIGRDREALRAKQTAARRQHKGGCARIDRTIEGKLDCDRLPNFARRPALCRAEARKSQQACQRSQKAADGNGLNYAHGGPETSCRAG